MSFVPGYEYDIFISYAHVDNDPVIEGKPGWIDFFEGLLRKRISVRLEGKIDIFRDRQLRRFGGVDDQLTARITNSAVFLCIISPGFITSEWCPLELEQFLNHADLNRIIKIVKTPFDERELQPETKPLLDRIGPLLESRFYKEDASSRLLTDLQPDVIAEHIPEALQKIDAIAQNLVELLKKLRVSQVNISLSSTVPTAQVAQPAGEEQIAVYLSKLRKERVTFDLRRRVETRSRVSASPGSG